MRTDIIAWLNTAFIAAAEHFAKPKAAIKIVLKSGRDHGDFACSSPLMLAKAWQLAPLKIAEFVAEQPLPNCLEQVWVAQPGFLNMLLAESYIKEELSKNLANTKIDLPTANTIVIDYSAPNLAKALHVGHLRTSLIGDSLVRINEYLGHKVIKQNHVGDWGTQFGMILAYIQHENIKLEELSSNINELEQIYLKAKILFDKSPEFANTARGNVVKLQNQDSESIKMWQKFRDISLQHCHALYQQLGLLLSPSDVVGESFYQPMLEPILTEISDKLNLSDGALCYFSKKLLGKDEQAMPMILRKQDGAYLYGTTDLAAAKYRLKNLNADKVLYVVDQRQSLHFNLLFELVKECGWAKAQLIHIGFGTVNAANGRPFKTRDGGTIKLSDLLTAAVAKAITVIESKQPDLSDADATALAEQIAISAIKYNDLSKPRNTDYAFCYEQMLRFDGNTAPYILYAYVRLNKIAKFNQSSLNFALPIELALAKQILGFNEAVRLASEESMPHHICNYIYDLASLSMRFYEQCPINSADNATKSARQNLAALVCKTIAKGLDLLGIKTMQRM